MENSDSIPGTSSENVKTFSYSNIAMGKILRGLEGGASFLNVPSTLNLKRNFEFETKRQCTLELHAITMVEYYKNNRIPRGMRSQLRPFMFTNDVDFRTKYEQISNKYALDLILLNIEHSQKELGTAREKTQKIEEDLRANLSPDDFAAFMLKQQDFLQKFKLNLQETKRRKWYRDIRDYQRGQVYTWSATPLLSKSQKEKRRFDKPAAAPPSDDFPVYLETPRFHVQQKRTRRGGRRWRRSRKNKESKTTQGVYTQDDQTKSDSKAVIF